MPFFYLQISKIKKRKNKCAREAGFNVMHIKLPVYDIFCKINHVLVNFASALKTCMVNTLKAFELGNTACLEKKRKQGEYK
ncbi:hypothetical protein D7V32_08275 [Acinetobacter tianfuensis]|uniref:Uncharacterized protein n=1 Tax=Acinetobacter tianfuensis TaxID=2419603 RepID=A0A3A8ERE3_9GAMM|nr:hypothetical protein D7V32_08275 [Acinetobacter tianfuensis]